MTPARFIAVLICLNVGLAIAVGLLAQRRSKPASPLSSDIEIVTTNVTRVVKLKPNSAAADTAGKFTWRSVQSDDLKQYIANLRAIHCPEETIQDIIVALVNKQFAAREASLKLRPQYAKPWELSALSTGRYGDQQQKLRALIREKQSLLKELLGVDVPTDFPTTSDFRNDEKFEAALKWLPESKRDQARAIQAAYLDKYAQLQQRTRGQFEPEDQDEAKRLRAERQDALAKLLTPQEFEDFELRTSSTASSLRSQLTGFDPTEKEFRALFRLRRQQDEFNASMSGLEPVDQAAQQKRAEAYQQMEQQIKTALGDERYAEYQRSQDSSFRNLTQLATQNGLPKETAIKGYEIRQTAIQEAQKLRQDQTLTPQQRKEAITAIKTETERAFAQTLGEKLYNTFKRRNPQWLDGNIR